MFIGEYKHSIDEKGRVAIPVKFRSDLIKGAVVTRGWDNCLFIHPLEEWEKRADKISKLPINQANARAYSRLTLAGAMDVQIDKQGRIILPDYLRKYANLEKTAVVAGLFDRLEIWNEQAWEEYKKRTEAEANEIAEKMGELGV